MALLQEIRACTIFLAFCLVFKTATLSPHPTEQQQNQYLHSRPVNGEKNQDIQNMQSHKGQGRKLYTTYELCPSDCSCEQDFNHTIQSVDCSDRSLTTVPSLPASARYVFLQGNSLVKVTCADFRHLYGLLFLDLSRNIRLSELSNCTFTSQDALENLILGSCNLFNLESNVFNPLRKLKYLDLSSNKISELKPQMFSGLLKLEHLNLYNNCLRNIANNSFLGIRSLTFLSLQKNRLPYVSGTFQSQAFNGLEALEVLNIQGNNPYQCDTSVVYPDEALSVLVNLRNLSMDGCPSKLGPGFRRLINLISLDLSTNFDSLESFCSMGTSIPNDFFSNIQNKLPFSLNMANCKLQKIPPELFKPLPNIVSLSIHDNRGLFLEGFRIGSEGLANSNLTYLDISTLYTNNGDFTYDEIRNTTFQHLKNTKLKSLIIQHNEIISINPQAILDLPRTLEYISVAHNKIQSHRFLFALLVLVNLKEADGNNQNENRVYLELSHTSSNAERKGRPVTPDFFNLKKTWTNFHADKQSETYDEATDRKYVLTQHATPHANETRDHVPESNSEYDVLLNRENNVNPGHVFSFEDLLSIDLIKSTVLLPLPKRVEIVHASNMKIGVPIPEIRIENNVVLRQLEYSNNLATVWKGPIRNAPSLQYLDLSKNFCAEMSLDFFKYLVNLRTLLVHDNYLGQTLDDDTNGEVFSTLTKLVTLDLHRNAITEMSPEAFINNHQLEVLNFSRNELWRFHPKLHNLSLLRKLDLSFNTIYGFSEQNCLDFRHIKSQNPNFTINLNCNHLVCTCEYLSFLNLVIHQPDIFENVQRLEFHLENGSILHLSELEDFLPELSRTCQTEIIFIFVLIVFSVYSGGLAVFAALYHMRWKLRYLFYIEKRRMVVGARRLTYNHIADVFLIYDDDFKEKTLLSETATENCHSIFASNALGNLFL